MKIQKWMLDKEVLSKLKSNDLGLLEQVQKLEADNERLREAFRAIVDRIRRPGMVDSTQGQDVLSIIDEALIPESKRKFGGPRY